MPLATIVNSPQITDALLWLLTFTDDDTNVVLRAVNNLEAVTSNGELFEPFPFELVLPPDDGKKPQNLTVAFPNVGRELMTLVREYPPGVHPQVRFDLVLSSAPDTIEKTVDFMEVISVSYDAMAINFQLASSSIFARKTCSATYNQAEFPGLFWGLR